jgi:membrane associated rhomboid family serine protease
MALDNRDYMRDARRRQAAGGSASVNAGQDRSVIVPIIVANVVVMVLYHIDPRLTTVFGISTSTLWHAWPVVTHMFIHEHLLLLAVNMWLLWSIGKPLERRIGVPAFLGLYLGSGILGAACWMVFHIGASTFLAGAGAAVCGMMIAAAFRMPNQLMRLALPPVVLRLRTFVGIATGIELLFYLTHGLHPSHLCGMFGGLMIMHFAGRRGIDTKKSADRIVANIKRKVAVASARVTTTAPVSSEPAATVRASASSDHNQSEPDDIMSTDVDPILDKIGRDGIQSLTVEDRAILDRVRDRLIR